MIAVNPVMGMTIGGSQPQPYESSPQTAVGTNVGLPPPSLGASYDRDLDSETNFYLTYYTGVIPVPDGTVEWSNFQNTPSPSFSIAWVDLKIKYRIPTATIDDTYRIEYKVDPDATWYVLKPDVAAEKFDKSGASRTHPWANLTEPNDDVWSWTDINNLHVRVYAINGGMPPDNKKMYVAEVWLSIYESAPSAASPTISVQPMHVPQVLWDWDLFFVDLYMLDMADVLGFTVIINFDPAYLWPADFMVYWPFQTDVISEIGSDYVSVSYVIEYGISTDEAFHGNGPIVRMWFYAMTAADWSDLTLSKHDVTDIYGDPIVNTGISGDYNKPPTYMSFDLGTLPPGDPTDTRWHELYPTYCDYWTLTKWTDNGDGDLTASDCIEMVNDDGTLRYFHVDDVTITIHWTFKPLPGEPGDAEPTEPLTEPLPNPIDTTWHQIYPDYCREFVITSWEDNEPGGMFDPSDQFDFEYVDAPGVTHWAHLDAITTDIILTPQQPQPPPVPEFPLGIGLLMLLAPIVPLAYLWRLRKKVMKQ
jgi:hypothetical protein